MAQSDDRARARTAEPRLAPPRRRAGDGPPSSFGRPEPAEPVQAPEPSPVSVVDGQVVLTVGARLLLDQACAQEFYDQVRDLTALAIRDGYAQALGTPATPPEQEKQP